MWYLCKHDINFISYNNNIELFLMDVVWLCIVYTSLRKTVAWGLTKSLNGIRALYVSSISMTIKLKISQGIQLNWFVFRHILARILLQYSIKHLFFLFFNPFFPHTYLYWVIRTHDSIRFTPSELLVRAATQRRALPKI